MSNKKNKVKPTKQHQQNQPNANANEEEYMELDEEEFQEEEEREGDEYNPEEVYGKDDDAPEEDEEEEQRFDIRKLSKKQKQVYDRNNNKIFFLKALAHDCYQDIEALAKKCGLYHRSEAEGVVGIIMALISETGKDIDYPERILKHFNRLVPEGYPNKTYLDAHDVNELTNLFRVYEEKAQNTAKITNPDEIWGQGKISNSKTINDSNTKKEHIVMMDSSQQQDSSQQYQQEPQGQGQPTMSLPMEDGQLYATPEARTLEYYANRYASPDIGLMEMALKRIPNTRPNFVSAFITSFTDLYTDWMANPIKMLEELKLFFGPTHGHHAFVLWRDLREKYMRSQGYAPLPGMGMGAPGGGSVGGGDYSPYGFGGQYGGYGQAQNMMGGMSPMYMSPDMMQQRDLDNRMRQLTNIIQLRMMEKAMENQTPSPIFGQNYEEVLDPNTGKVIKRVFLSGGNGYGGGSGGNGMMQNPLENAFFTGMTQMFQEVLRGVNNEKVELYKKLNTPDNTFADLAKTMMSNYVANQNPASQIREMMEITNMIKQQTPQDNQSKSLDAIKMEIDSKIALQELDMRKMEMQHNWRMDEKQQTEQDNNVDKWLNVMLQMGEGIIKPVAMKFVEGFGAGGRMPNPLGGLFGGGAGQQGPPIVERPSPQQQQYQAMREQQMYTQQQAPQQQYQQPPQQGHIPPMNPLPPRMQPTYNPSHPQVNPALQKPVSQISEQELQNELGRLTPEQIQEIEDRMMLDDSNRERVKNAIRAYKNAKRFTSRPRPSDQQQEAQNVFNPSIQQRQPQEEDEGEELEDFDEEDFEDEEEEEDEARFVPIARGTSKAPEPDTDTATGKTLSFKQFMPESTTETIKRKKLTPKQQAMLSEGQLSPKELRNAPDIDYEEGEGDEDEYSGVPIAGIRNASEDVLVEENLSRTKQEPSAKKTRRKKTVEQEETPKEEVEVEAPQQESSSSNLVEEAEDILNEAELIPSDDFE